MSQSQAADSLVCCSCMNVALTLNFVAPLDKVVRAAPGGELVSRYILCPRWSLVCRTTHHNIGFLNVIKTEPPSTASAYCNMKDGAGFYLPAINGQWVDILDQKMQAEQQRPVLKHTNNEQMLHARRKDQHYSLFFPSSFFLP